MKHISQSIEFKTDKFDLTSELNEELNAGNQLYGEDISDWLSKALESKWETSYLDEDWGWLIDANKKGNNDSHNTICVYDYKNEENLKTNDGVWFILIHTSYKQRFLRFFKKMRYGETDIEIVNDIVSALENYGIKDIELKQQNGFN